MISAHHYCDVGDREKARHYREALASKLKWARRYAKKGRLALAENRLHDAREIAGQLRRMGHFVPEIEL